MNASESPTVGHVFELLNRSRHLPFYSLETRAAPFFAIFLRDVLKARFKTEIQEAVIPEFPLRIGTLCKDERNQSYNVDYVAFGKDNRAVYLVELKTDMDSRREAQDEYLAKARDIDFIDLLEGVRKSAKASNRKQKYVHLLHRLHLAGFVSKDDALCNLYERSFGKVVPGWTEALKGLEFKAQRYSKPKVVFVQPKKGKSDKKKSENHGFEFIYFEQVANIVQSRGELGRTFAKYLRRWTEDAGSPHPRCIHRS